MSRQNSTNYTGAIQFPYATAGTDLFLKEDVQVLAQAVDQHDHSSGKGLPIASGALTWPLVGPSGAFIGNSVSKQISITESLLINGPPTGTILYMGNSTKEYIRTPLNNGANLSVESSDGALTLSGLASSNMAVNGYFDGASWNRYSTGSGALLAQLQPDGFHIMTAPTGAGSIVWTNQFNIATNGDVYTNGNLNISVAGKQLQFIDGNTHIVVDSSRMMAFDTFNAPWYFRDTANGSVIRMVLQPTNEGRLGIGAMTQPAAQLHVKGSAIAGANTWANRVNTSTTSLNLSAGFAFIDDTYGGGGNGGALYFGCQGLFLSGICASFTNGASYGTGRMSFGIRSNAADTTFFEILSLDPNKNIYGGVGTQMYAVAFNPTSARRFKTDFAPLGDPLGLVLDDRVHAVSYTDLSLGTRKVGFVAEDWLEVLPEVVDRDQVGEVLALDYDHLSAVTFEALKRFAIDTDTRLKALEMRMAA